MDSMNGTDSGSCDPVTLANKLLRQCNSSHRVRNVEDIRSKILADMYVGFLAESPQGLISSPITQEDEIHNCQVIIDHLASNLHTSLSHIRGRSIIEGDTVVIQNLLEIIAMLADIILNKIDSDISVDLDDTHTSGHFVPSNNVTGELSSRDLRWDSPVQPPVSLTYPTYQPPAGTKTTHVSQRNGVKDTAKGQDDSPDVVLTDDHMDRASKLFQNSSNLLERASDLLRRSKDLNLEHFPTRNRSPPPTIKENTWVSPGRLDSTEYLVREGERIQQRLDNTGGPLYQPHTKTTGEGTTSMFGHLGVRPKMTRDGVIPDASKDTSKDKPSDFSASAPLPRRQQTPEKDRFRATVGPVDYTEKHTTPGLSTAATVSSTAPTTSNCRLLTAKGLASSYTDLHSLVSETAAYVRAAVRTSPVRSKLDQDLIGDYPPRLTMAGLSDRRVPPTTSTVPAADGLHLARDLNSGPSRMTSRSPDDITRTGLDYSRTSPGGASRRVSFLEERSYGSSDLSREKPGKTRDEGDNFETIRVDIHRKPQPLSSRTATLSSRAGEKYGSYTDLGYLSDNELENGKHDARLRKRFHKMIDTVLAGEDSRKSAASRKSRPVNKQVRFQSGKQKTSVSSAVTAPTKPRKKVRGVLIDTRQHLVKENKTQKKKTQILKKMYEEDLDDLSEEFKEQMGRSRKEAKDTENQFKKKVLTKPKGAKVPKKTEVSIKVVPSKKTCVTKPTVSSKVRKRSTGSHVAKRAMSMTDDEDLMPVLLEEFPHLYLSEHTWHELWRRGINQIDQLTRTYAESKRKKSHAQVQVEEAEKRHEILVNLVKKQLEHSKRLEDIKDQRSQQASVQNKLHEKRMQSARARKYYNEYQVRMRAKMLRRRTREEMIFKKLFDECLGIQKERIQEVRKYAKEQRSNHAEQRNNEIQSMENYYKDQFSILAERVAKERTEMEIREKAQQKMLCGMKKDLRRHMEHEIKDFQEQMFRDEDDAYFRQLDADKLRHGLQLAKFQTHV